MNDEHEKMHRLGQHAPLAAPALLLSLMILGCGGGHVRKDVPVPSTANSLEVQRAFARLQRAWDTSSNSRKLSLEADLREFRNRFPTDPLAAKAAAYEALVAVKKHEYEQALRLIRKPLRGPAGDTRDIALTVRALVAVGQGRTERAHRQLELLADKLLDRSAQQAALHGLVVTSMKLRRWDTAVDAMARWLGVANQQDVPQVVGEITSYIESVPAEVLVEQARADKKRNNGIDKWPKPFLRLVLTRIRQHPPRPIDGNRFANADGPLSKSSTATKSRDPATKQGSSLSSIAPPPVVVFTQTGNDSLRRRSAEMVSGWLSVATFRFEVRASGAGNENLAKLCRIQAHEGVRLIIGGLDPQSSSTLANCAEQEPEITVLLLVAPENSSANNRVFVIGERQQWGNDARTFQAAMTVAGDGASVVHVIEHPLPSAQSGAWSCASVDPLAGPPVETWLAQGTRAIALDGSAQCARDVLEALAAHKQGNELPIWLGLEASADTHRPEGLRGHLWVSEAGEVGAAVRTSSDGPLREWYATRGQAPSWFEALGHDAASLTGMALADSTQRAVFRKLQTAHAQLWTTTKQGFGIGEHRIHRQIRFRELKATTSDHPR